MNENENNNKNNVYEILAKKRESMIRGNEKKKRKAGSVHQATQDNKKINININQNININTNNKDLEREKRSKFTMAKRKTIDVKKKGMRMKSCILALEKPVHSQKNNKLYLPKVKIEKNPSKEMESSFKMDNLPEKKTDSRNVKKEQFFEFFINDNIKNRRYYLKDNLITTTKYNVFTFIPKSLLYQFSRLSNVYFLFTAIIQSIPLISPLTSLTAIIPLIFVLGISMIRELIEDLVRNTYDNLNNNEEVIVLRNNRFVKSVSKTLQYGEIILVYENKNIPADMILIDTGFEEGICYVETSSLDGEKTLKLKVANKYTQGFISNDMNKNKGIEKLIQPGNYTFDGYIKINAPNIDLNYVNGTFHALFQKEGCFIEEDINISTNEFLLKGSILKNTNWIIGIVVYTGMNNKIILNSKKPRLKMSKVEKTLNYYLLFIFLFLIICCIECSLSHHFEYTKHKKFYDNFIFISNNPNTESFIVFFTYFLLLNTMIPISLIVSTEIIKMVQGIFMRWDVLLYSKTRHCCCSVKSVSIIEELGNVNFIFSDKTGTLTKNQLQFKYCVIDNKFYEFNNNKNVEIKKNDNVNNQNEEKINKKSANQINIHKSSKVFVNPNEFFKKHHDTTNNSKLMLNEIEDSSFIEDEDNEKKRNLSDNKSIQNKNYKKKSDNYINRIRVVKRQSINTYKKEISLASNQISNYNQINDSSVISENKNDNDKSENENKSEDKSEDKSVDKSEDKSESENKSEDKNEDKSEDNSNNKSESDNKIIKLKKSENNSESESYIESVKSYSIKNEKTHNVNNKKHINHNNYKNNNTIEERRGKKNSTILEIKNEECESSSTYYQIIPFGEAYFQDGNLSKKEGPFNYINEFWKALALTNECIIKDDKGEIKYMGTSPDDLELVKAASRQGYKLIETSINTKTIRISGKDYSYEILKVLGFSSERKRMSIIVRDKSGIKLYIKGADSEISKRLSKKSLENENYEIISNGLIEFSKRGLRTLMVAYRKIRQKDYDSWVNRLHEDELNIQNKQKLMERLYDFIENNLILIGGTVVEDKLQDKVPETIKELRSAGIKIWVLTGDKLDTAENIGHSCNLLSKEQKLFTLKVMPGDDEEIVKEDPYPEIIQFLSEFQEFIDGLVKKYNLDTKYTGKIENDNNSDINYYNYNLDEISEISQSNYQNSSNISNYSVKSKIIDFETFIYLKEKQILEPFSIIIEAPILCGLFKDEEWTKNFLRIAYYSNTVICCRVSPSQKSEVIKKMKEFDQSAVTLAIGDGGNDVSMIMEANIGIGIYGEEGMSAAQASDFAIGEFKLLKRLLFIHGRINLYRISKMILYFFYKNFVFTIIQFFFSFFSLVSGQTIIDDWYITCYNLIFTAFPLCIAAVTDTDIDINDQKEKKKNFALLYKENRDKYRIFSFTQFILKSIKGTIISLLIFFFSIAEEILINGRTQNIWIISLKSYISTLVIVSSNLLMTTNFIVLYLPLSLVITTFLLFIIFLILNHYGLLFTFNSKASIFPLFCSYVTYLSIIITCFYSIIMDYTLKLIDIYFSDKLSSKIMLEKMKEDKRKSFFGLNSKSYTKQSKEKKRNSLPLEARSNSYLISQVPNKLKYLNNNVKTPKSNVNLKDKEYFSLKYIKKINLNDNNDNTQIKKYL